MEIEVIEINLSLISSKSLRCDIKRQTTNIALIIAIWVLQLLSKYIYKAYGKHITSNTRKNSKSIEN